MSNDQNLAIEPWLQSLWDQGGSDLLLSSGSPPRIRVDGKLRPIPGAKILTGGQIDDIAKPLLTDGQRIIFDEQLDVDFAFSWGDKARIRGSIFTARGQTALALRVIPTRIPSFEELGLPYAANWVSEQPRGFVLVTGPTGSGKSTTLASIVNSINENRACHILTIEDPVEYVHHHKTSAVSQREVGLDSPSFDRALRSALREDPDVLLIGEMRDIDSIQIALTMAETGHLVFATLHQEQTRVQLAASLCAVIAQRLVPKIGGGMVAAFEVLIATHPVRNLIREGRSNQLQNVMFTNQKEGMQTLENSLAALIVENVISYEDAMATTAHPKELIRTLEQLDKSRIPV
jgi:twitching motility protein PilT